MLSSSECLRGGVGHGERKGDDFVTKLRECDVAEQFLNQADEESFNALFRVFSPQLVGFFRRRGNENGVAEDLAQEVMLTAYRRAGQLRDHKLFRAWLFKVARNAACRYFVQRTP